jgi:hypothetical protein
MNAKLFPSLGSFRRSSSAGSESPKKPCLLQRAACLRAVSRYASLIHCRYFDQIRAVRSREALFTALTKGQ